MDDPTTAFYDLERASLDDFESEFSHFKKNARRVEIQSYYNIPSEQGAFQTFLSGQLSPTDSFNKEWHSFLDGISNSGKSFSRTRIIQVPITDYVRFEIAWGYTGNIEHGEDIKFTLVDNLVHFEKFVPILKDFVIFDESLCFLMDYDATGRFLGIDRVPERHVGMYLAFAVDLFNEGMSLQELQARLS